MKPTDKARGERPASDARAARGERPARDARAAQADTGAGAPRRPGRRAKPRHRPCPICGKSAVETYVPFCSRRCADIDLGRWLGGRYVIPGPPVDLAETGAGMGADADEPDTD